MRALPLPTLKAENALADCAARVRERSDANRFLGASAVVTAAEVTYLAAGGRTLLFRVASTEVVGPVKGDEMVWLYDNPFSRKNSPVRPRYYDKLKASAPHGRCPYCAWRTVATLDHYLAKSTHPALAVTPANLVPSCSDCNKVKLTTAANCAGEQLLHPYFDNVDGEVWLKAIVMEDSPPTLVFVADPPESWPLVRRQRVAYHMKTLRLETLYASHGARLVAEIASRLNKLREQGGRESVRAHLAEEAATRRVEANNCWQVAAYQAMSESGFFCDYHHRR